MENARVRALKMRPSKTVSPNTNLLIIMDYWSAVVRSGEAEKGK